MPGINTTGLPNTQDYVLGRGTLYYAAIDANGKVVGPYRDLGNGPSLKINQTTTALEHASSRSGLKVIDKKITVEQKVEVLCDLDEINFDNLALAFAGNTNHPTNATIAGFANYNMITVASGGAVLGRWYDLKDSNGVRAYDVLAANLTVKLTGGATLVKDTDYTLDQKMGRIFLIAPGGTITAGVGIDVAITARGGAAVLDEVRALVAAPPLGAFKFIGENPANGNKQMEVQIHQIAFSAEGQTDLIGDQIAKISLKGVAERNPAVDPNSPYFSIRTHANA